MKHVMKCKFLSFDEIITKQIDTWWIGQLNVFFNIFHTYLILCIAGASRVTRNLSIRV